MPSLRLLTLAVTVALASALAGCGSNSCGPATCAGCCDDTGLCHSPEAANCGAGGAACVACPGIEACSAAGICSFGGGTNQTGSGNGSGNGNTTSASSSNGSSNGSGSTGGTTTGSGSTGSTGNQPICGPCVNGSDCQSGFCDMLGATSNVGFCDSASPCTSNASCDDVVACDPTGGGYCLCPAATTGTTGQVTTSGSTGNATTATNGSSTGSITTGGASTGASSSSTTSTASSSSSSTTTGGSTSTSTSTSTTTTGGSTSTSTSTGTTGTTGTTGVTDQCGVVQPEVITCSGTCATGYTCSNGVCQLNGGTGALQISLRWNTSDDFDLHVVEPGGCEISYAKLTCVGSLVLDANPGCGSNAAPNSVENVTYAGVTPPSGTYSVVAHDYMTCSQTATVPFEVVVRDGATTNVTCGSFVLADQETAGGAATGKTVATFSYP